jgi:cytochrome c oxidase subunit II
MMRWFAKNILLLPEVDSKGGVAVDNLIVYVHLLMLALFVGWIIYFFYALYRFRASRNPRADYHGVRSHISNYIELAVAAIEAILLVCIAVPLWAKAESKFPSADNSTVIQIVAQQYAWNVLYPGPDKDFGDESMDLVSETNVFGLDNSDKETQDDVQTLNDIHCVVNKPVIIYVGSKDVIHSLKINAMRVCQDAIPGLRIPVWFTPDKIGRYQVNCAQLCGPGHSGMSGGFLIVQSQADFDNWIASQSRPASPSPSSNPFE